MSAPDRANDPRRQPNLGLPAFAKAAQPKPKPAVKKRTELPPVMPEEEYRGKLTRGLGVSEEKEQIKKLEKEVGE